MKKFVNYQFKNLSCFASAFVITILLTIVTFPQLDLIFTHGGDAPLIWVYNWLFQNDFSSARTILFPHGPLDFLIVPLADNLVIFLIVDFLIKYIFVLLLCLVNEKIHKSSNLLSVVVCAYVLFFTTTILTISLFIILFSFILFFETNKALYKYLGFILIAFCVYLKAYSCVVAGTIGASFLIYNLIQTKNYKQFFIDVFSLWVIIFLMFIFLFHKLTGFGTYFLGILNLSFDNSSACSFYPDNNWWYVAICISISILIPFINKTKQSIFYGCMMILSVFSAFKHGMAREEGMHIVGLWLFLLANFICFMFYIRSRSLLNITLSIISLIFLYLNFNYKSSRFELPNLNLVTINNFVNFTSNYNSIIENAKKQTEENISYRKLSNELRGKIGKSSVDVYPWDYSIIAANNFKWHPRPIINSYAAYTSWLDKQDALYFESENAPDYFIWDFSKGMSPSIDESEMISLDNRYLLNDEPQTLLRLLSNYEFISYENNLNIYKKRNELINYHSQKTELTRKLINEWIKVPEYNNQKLVRAKVNFKRNFLQRLKSFFYKDEQYWIYLKLADNTIQKFKIVPNNAKDGIWVSPLIYKPKSNSNSLIVKEIMFKNSNQELLNSSFDFQFEVFDFGKQNVLLDFFPKSIDIKDTLCFEKQITFDDNDKLKDLDCDKGRISLKNGFNNSKSFLIYPNEFTPSYKIDIDSFSTVEVKSTCWINLYNKDAIGLSYVFNFEDVNGNVIEWKSVNLQEQIINKNDWNFCSHYIKLPFNSSIKKLSVSLWNNSKDTISFDDFYLKVKYNKN